MRFIFIFSTKRNMKRSLTIILLLVILLLTEAFSMSIWKQRFQEQSQRNNEKEIERMLEKLDMATIASWLKEIERELYQMKENHKRKLEEEIRKKQEEEMKRIKLMQSFVKTYLGDASVMKDFFANRII